MSPNALRELSRHRALRDRWVAIDPSGARPKNDRNTPLCLSLASGAIVVDADDELDVLCARLKAEGLSSLTIVYNGKK